MSVRSKVLPVALFILASLAPQSLRAANTKADEQAGALLFRDKGCAYCHGAGGKGGKKGPILTDIRTNKLWPPEKMTSQIYNGGIKMPPFGESLTDAEIAQIVAYLRAKHRPEPPPSTAPPPPPQQ